MSDTSQGPGWWIASDGKWYAPEQAADYVPPPPPEPEPELPAPPTAEIPVVPPPVPPPMSPPPAPSAAPPMAQPQPPPPLAPPIAPPVGPPPPIPPVAGAAQAPAKKSGNGCLKAFIIVAVLLVLLGAGTVAVFAFFVDKAVNTVNSDIAAQEKVEKQTGIRSNPLGFNAEHPPQKDISADDMSCTTDSSGDMKASGTLTNHSSKTSLYSITISFRQNGNEIATGADFLPSVDAGETADWTALSSVEANGTFTCRIVEIDRLDVGTITPPTTK